MERGGKGREGKGEEGKKKRKREKKERKGKGGKKKEKENEGVKESRKEKKRKKRRSFPSDLGASVRCPPGSPQRSGAAEGRAPSRGVRRERPEAERRTMSASVLSPRTAPGMQRCAAPGHVLLRGDVSFPRFERRCACL